eukprot:1156892-Pelagomonas_calceolata.AAC.11
MYLTTKKGEQGKESTCWQVAGKCASRLAAAATSSCRMGSGTACSPCATRKAREAAGDACKTHMDGCEVIQA